MPYVLFREHCREIAERETRTIFVTEHSDLGLPAGHYAFLEMFCDEAGCDCRRVFFYVVSSFREDVEAVIAYGWEKPDFYAKWMKDDDPHIVSEIKGPVLNSGSPQSKLAPAILDLVRNVLLRDETYVERVRQHYSLFREKVDAKGEANLRMKKKRKKKKRSS